MSSILVVQLKRLGDTLLTTAALSALRDLYPGAQITFLIDRASQDLVPAISGVNEIWTYDRASSLGLWLKLLSRSFDLCIDFTGNDRSALITFLSRANRRYGFRSFRKKGVRSWVYTNLCASSVRERHTVDHYLDLVKMLNYSVPTRGPALAIPSTVYSSAEQLRQQLGLTGVYFVIHPGTARVEKFWETEQWAEIIRYVSRRLRIPCLITGGRDQGELRQIREIQEKVDTEVRVYSIAGRVDFLMTAALIAHAQLFLGVDTAAAHVATIFERPEVVLFGPTNPFHWAPRHSKAVVVRAGYAFPYQPIDPREKGYAMSHLSTETVIRAIESVIEAAEVGGGSTDDSREVKGR